MAITKKTKIFICNDASFVKSGYGIYGKQLLTRLHGTGKYEIAELGCYATKDNPQIRNIPWKFYPNAVSDSDPKLSDFKKSPLNQFGRWRFNECLLDFKPHIVFDVRDYWMYSYQEVSPLRKYFNWVLMPTVDSAPQKLEWLFTFCNADVVVPYTEWARKILGNSCGHKINLFKKNANAGIDPTEFYPLENKEQIKENFFGSKDVKIIGTVMRNQKRKLFDDLMIAFRKYLNRLVESNNIEEYNNTFLYLHTSFPEEHGWDLPTLLYENRVLDKTYLTYVCRQCKKYFPSKYRNAVCRCPSCNNVSATLSSVSVGVEESQMNEIYNTFDIYIQYAICEGFGMPQIEAAACGVPIMSVDYSAMTEIVDNLNGIKIPVDRLFREMETSAYRAYPDIDYTSDAFYEYLINTSETNKKNKRESTRNNCINHYTWDSVAKVWEECFDSIDINSKLDWHKPNPNLPNHVNKAATTKLNPRDFVEFICQNVINEPELLKTAFVQNLIKDLTCGISCKGGVVSNFSYREATKILENYLANKMQVIEFINKNK